MLDVETALVAWLGSIAFSTSSLGTGLGLLGLSGSKSLYRPGTGVCDSTTAVVVSSVSTCLSSVVEEESLISLLTDEPESQDLVVQEEGGWVEVEVDTDETDAVCDAVVSNDVTGNVGKQAADDWGFCDSAAPEGEDDTAGCDDTG